MTHGYVLTDVTVHKLHLHIATKLKMKHQFVNVYLISAEVINLCDFFCAYSIIRKKQFYCAEINYFNKCIHRLLYKWTEPRPPIITIGGLD